MGNTVNEFWEMIWDNDVNTIVMLTELEENDIVSQRITICFYHTNYSCLNYFLLQKKCFQYWPEFFSGFNDYGSLHVKLEQRVDGGFFITRHFTISKEGSKDIRNVQHFQLLDWVQSKIPRSTEKFLDFVQAVEKSRSQTSVLAPLVVHGRYMNLTSSKLKF